MLCRALPLGCTLGNIMGFTMLHTECAALLLEFTGRAVGTLMGLSSVVNSAAVFLTLEDVAS